MTDTAVILAGGKSVRYGRPKGLETVHGVTLVERIAGEMRKCGIRDLLLSTDEPELYAGMDLPIVSDRFPGCGPLAGIHAALAETGAFEILVMPCDLPGITEVEIKILLEAASRSESPVIFAVSGEHEHPLCSVVRGELTDFLEKELSEGRLGALRCFKSIDHETVRFDDSKPFHNVNTPEDLATWEKGSGC